MTQRPRTRSQLEADRRWPDAMDMVQPAIGDGRWATVSWCAGLLVMLHRTFSDADRALLKIDGSGCGHGCWWDHELVDLAVRGRIDVWAEQARGQIRAAHAETCRVCRYVFSRQPPAAALQRSRAWQRAAA